MKRCPGKTIWLFVLLTVSSLLSATPSMAGDAFLRAGVIFHPSDIEFQGRWRVAFGSDYAANYSETLFVGFEVQTSVFRQDVATIDRTATIMPANGFINVKVKSGAFDVRPYAGGGVGLLSTFIWLSGDNSWEREMGFQFLGGVELARFSIELQIQRAFESGSSLTYAIYGGFVF